jgi:hypothetical protein
MLVLAMLWSSPLKRHSFSRGRAVAITTATVVVVALATAFSTASAVQAAQVRGNVNRWRLDHIWSRTEGQFYAAASSGPKDAWAVGITGPAANPKGPLAAHWNGRSWRTVSVPGSKGLIFDQVAESSAKNVWVVGEPTKPNVNSTAFVYNGKHWHTVALPIGPVLQLLVLGPSDVWVENDNYCSSYSCTENIYHWNGTTWQSDPLTTYLYALTATSDSNLWAVGFSAIPSGYLTAYRWSGTQWVARSIPRVRGADFLGAAAWRSEVWISSVTTNGRDTYVLRKNTRSWTKLTAPDSVPAFAAPVADGHGGVWLGSQAHWTGRKWLAEWLPSTFTEGWTGVNAAFVKVPGTTGSYWSLGYNQTSSRAATRPAVAVFGPVP